MRICFIDCGGTKSDIAFLQGSDVSRIKIEGFNPLTHVWEDFFYMLDEQIMDYPPCDEVHLFVSGHVDPVDDEYIRIEIENRYLTPREDVRISSDLMAVAKAYYQEDPLIVGILGTGSNAGFYDGQKLEQRIPSLGYILADEGGGADFGKRLLRMYYYDELELELKRKMDDTFELNRELVLPKIYSDSSVSRASLASYMPFIFEYRQYPQLHQMLHSGFDQFIKSRLLMEIQGRNAKMIGLCGSVAHVFKDIITDLISTYTDLEIRINKSPLDLLIKKHLH